MWAYIYYSIYLDMIDTSNHNAIEQYVYKKVRNYLLISSLKTQLWGEHE